MAVDQARQVNNFFREMLSTNPIQIGDNINNLYNNNNNIISSMANESLLLPFYNLNDVVFAGKLQPAVKDDSGVTFNNSLVPPSVQQPSRKRQRDATVLQTPAMISSNGVQSMLNPITTVVKNETSNNNNNGYSFLGEDFSLQIMQQQLDLDRLISQHMEKMRVEIEDRKKQQLRRVMVAIEEAMLKKMREKEEEIIKIGKINWALEERVKSLCLENQIWRDLAQTNEATANALRTNLEQVLQNVDRPLNGGGGGGCDLTDDAVSCCGSSGYGGEEERENEVQDGKKRRGNDVVNGGGGDGGEGKKWIYRGKIEENKRLCRNCGEGESSVLLLPCRHLCLCTLCGPAVNSCPICNSPKNASVHVNLS